MCVFFLFIDCRGMGHESTQNTSILFIRIKHSFNKCVSQWSLNNNSGRVTNCPRLAISLFLCVQFSLSVCSILMHENLENMSVRMRHWMCVALTLARYPTDGHWSCLVENFQWPLFFGPFQLQISFRISITLFCFWSHCIPCMLAFESKYKVWYYDGEYVVPTTLKILMLLLPLLIIFVCHSFNFHSHFRLFFFFAFFLLSVPVSP